MTDPKPENAIIPTDPHSKPAELPADLEELIQAGQAELGAHIKTVGDATATRLAEVQRQMEAGEKEDLTPAEKLARAQELLNEWQVIREQARGQKVAFDEAVRMQMGIDTFPDINTHLAWLTRKKDFTDWESKGGEAVLQILDERLWKYPQIIAACKKVIDRFRVPGQAGGASPERTSGREKERLTNFHIQLNAARQLVGRWYELVQMYQAAAWKGKKLYDQLREAGTGVDARQMGQWRDGLEHIAQEFEAIPSTQTADKHQEYINEVTPRLRAIVQAAEAAAHVLDESSTPPTAPARPDVTTGPAHLDAKASKRFEFLDDLKARFLERYNAVSLRLEERERSAGDDRQYRALRDSLNSALADFQSVSDPDTLRRYAVGAMEMSDGQTKVSDGYLDVVDRMKVLTARIDLLGQTLGETAAEKDGRAAEETEFREHLGRAKDLVAMGIELRQWFGTRWDKKILPELRQRASMRYPNIFEVEEWLKERTQTHQWQGKESDRDRQRLVEERLPMLEEMVSHMRDIAREMHEAGEIKKDLPRGSADMVRKAREEREQFEQKVEQGVQTFVAKLDGALRQQGKDAKYRMSALLSHLPNIVDALAERLKGGLVLSPTEKKAMLKKCNADVIDSIGE